MKCTNCGNDFEGKFCPECGTPAPRSATCPNCGAEAVSYTHLDVYKRQRNVDPLPAHGSITTSPISVNIRISFFNSFTGFCVGCILG